MINFKDFQKNLHESAEQLDEVMQGSKAHQVAKAYKKTNTGAKVTYNKDGSAHVVHNTPHPGSGGEEAGDGVARLHKTAGHTPKEWKRDSEGKGHRPSYQGHTSSANGTKMQTTVSKFGTHTTHITNESCNMEEVEHIEESRKPIGVKGSESGDRYEMHQNNDGTRNIIKTHQAGKHIQNQWGGYTTIKTGKDKYIQKHFDKLGEEVEIEEEKMSDAEMDKREKIVKSMKKSYKDFVAKYGNRAKEVMYATATKRAMGEETEIEEELEEERGDEYGWDVKAPKDKPKPTSRKVAGKAYGGAAQKDDDDEDDKPEQSVKRGRGRPAGSKSGARQKGNGSNYGGLTFHSLNLPNGKK